MMAGMATRILPSQNCSICKEWSNPTQDLQKIIDLKKFGLAIYRHMITIPEDERVLADKTVDQMSKTYRNQSKKKTKDIFILHNIKDVEISASDIVSELRSIERRKIKCTPCLKVVKRALTLLRNVPIINKNEVRGVCDLCFTDQKHCSHCDNVIKRFMTSPSSVYIKKRQWLAKFKHLHDDKIGHGYSTEKILPKQTRQPISKEFLKPCHSGESYTLKIPTLINEKTKKRGQSKREFATPLFLEPVLPDFTKDTPGRRQNATEFLKLYSDTELSNKLIFKETSEKAPRGEQYRHQYSDEDYFDSKRRLDEPYLNSTLKKEIGPSTSSREWLIQRNLASKGTRLSKDFVIYFPSCKKIGDDQDGQGDGEDKKTKKKSIEVKKHKNMEDLKDAKDRKQKDESTKTRKKEEITNQKQKKKGDKFPKLLKKDKKKSEKSIKGAKQTEKDRKGKENEKSEKDKRGKTDETDNKKKEAKQIEKVKEDESDKHEKIDETDKNIKEAKQSEKDDQKKSANKIPEKPSDKENKVSEKVEQKVGQEKIKSTKSKNNLKTNKIQTSRERETPLRPELPKLPVPRKAIRKSPPQYDNDLNIDNDVMTCDKKDESIFEAIIGPKICKLKFPYVPKKDETDIFVRSINKEEKLETKRPVQGEVLQDKIPDVSSKEGITRYALSDRTFIDKGWTMLPTESIVKKVNMYRMRPAKPEFDWFKRNKNKLLKYDTGEILSDFDENGRARWYYRNGRVALEYYKPEEKNAKRRFIIYSSGEPDDRGRLQPYTVLAVFDYLGNGIVYDHTGKIRLKYNQTEGMLFDRNVGPETHWQWHTLNNPPVLQQVLVDTYMPNIDKEILKLGSTHPAKKERENQEDMVAIELENYLKEKSTKLNQSFKPFQITMKALKINKHFSLKVLNQATIYINYRDGATNLKFNVGMILDPNEIIDTLVGDVGVVYHSLEKYPPITDSVTRIQKSVKYSQNLEKMRIEHNRRLKKFQSMVLV